jgi:hypothetical protein
MDDQSERTNAAVQGCEVKSAEADLFLCEIIPELKQQVSRLKVQCNVLPKTMPDPRPPHPKVPAPDCAGRATPRLAQRRS